VSDIVITIKIGKAPGGRRATAAKMAGWLTANTDESVFLEADLAKFTLKLRTSLIDEVEQRKQLIQTVGEGLVFADAKADVGVAIS
jgi:hypothetical protein